MDLDFDEVAALCEEAYRNVAPKKLIDRLETA